MKLKLKALLSIAFIGLGITVNLNSFSQSAPTERNRYIQVTGSAEISVKPDELELEFTLKEYYKKGTKEKFNLSLAEQEFFRILARYGLKQKDIILDNDNLYSGSWYYWWRNRKEELKYKKINIKIDSSANVPALVKDLDKDWLSDISISNMKNKNEQNFRKEVKIQAIKAAKEKAMYLLSAINEEIGKVISVEEINDNDNSYSYHQNAALSNTIVPFASNSASEGINNTSLIKLKYEIKVTFEIK